MGLSELWARGPNADAFDKALTLQSEHAARLRRYRRNWKFYKGDHWHSSKRRKSQDDDDPAIVLNYCQAMADKHVNFLFKGGVKIIIPDDPATKESDEKKDRDFVRDQLVSDWRDNQMARRLFEIGQMGSITGDVFIKTVWETEDPLAEKPFPRLDVLPSSYVFPIFGGPFGVDRRKMESVIILYPRYKSGREVTNDLSPFIGKVRQIKRDIVLRMEWWWPDKYQVHHEDGTLEEFKNPWGEIPIVHIPNYVMAGEFFGRSDISAITYLNQELNEKLTDVSDVVNYHGSPITIFEGASVSKLERGPNRMWGTPMGAKVYNLELQGDMKANLEYIALIKTAMHELSSLPEGILSAFTTGDRTGVALAMKYMPVLELRAVKMMLYGRGLRELNRLLLKTREIMDDRFAKKLRKLGGNRYRNDLVWPKPLPRDEAVVLDTRVKKLDAGLTSREAELEDMGLSQAEIVKIMDQSDEDMKKRAAIEMMLGSGFGPTQDSGNPNPERGNPEARGEAVSRAAG